LTRDYATGDSAQAHQAPERRRWTEVMMHRWPTALGIAVAALITIDLQLNVEFVSFLSAVVVVMALVYVGAAILDRRNYAWVVFLAAFAVLALTQVLDLKINLPLVYLVVALAFVMLGVVRGQLRRPSSLTLQAAGMLTFGATALVAFYVDPDSWVPRGLRPHRPRCLGCRPLCEEQGGRAFVCGVLRRPGPPGWRGYSLDGVSGNRSDFARSSPEVILCHYGGCHVELTTILTTPRRGSTIDSFVQQ
jgi:hypothetical protein